MCGFVLFMQYLHAVAHRELYTMARCSTIISTFFESLVSVGHYRLHSLVHGQVTIIFVVSVCLFVQSFTQPSSSLI